MCDYVIGIIDDEEFNIKMIKGIIKAQIDKKVEFKTYFINDQNETSISQIYKEIFEDIVKNKLTTLIIDEKILSDSNELRGSEIFRNIKQSVDKFPMIVLTNFPDDCMKDNIIDPDKIYKKIDFLNMDSAMSKELVKKIFLNAQKYVEQRSVVEKRTEELEDEIKINGYKPQIVSALIENEEKLQELKPTDYRQIEKIMKPDEIRDILTLLKEAKNLLE